MTSSVPFVGSPSLSPRVVRGARRLTKERTREKLARGIERAIHDAEHPRGLLTSAVPVRPAAVIQTRAELHELAARLRAPGPVYAQGVAAARNLLVDPDGPLYQSGLDLNFAVHIALAALNGHVE
jgi:hypothetical protein